MRSHRLQPCNSSSIVNHLSRYTYKCAITSTALSGRRTCDHGELSCIKLTMEDRTCMAKVLRLPWPMQDGTAGEKTWRHSEVLESADATSSMPSRRSPWTSFCFRNLWEFSFKMQGASHADRLYNRLNWEKFIDHKRIQDKICKGEDLFDMLPEAYTWHELIRLWRGATRSISVANLPRAVIENTQRFRWLLPGGCVR